MPDDDLDEVFTRDEELFLRIFRLIKKHWKLIGMFILGLVFGLLF